MIQKTQVIMNKGEKDFFIKFSKTIPLFCRTTSEDENTQGHKSTHYALINEKKKKISDQN